jgi:hypothetical protein
MHSALRCSLITIVCLLFFVPDGIASSLSNIASKFDRSLATFDPIGKHIRAPIEKAIPRLQFNGSLRQSSDMLLKSKDNGEQLTEKDFRFLQLQNLLEMETSYYVNSAISINATAHLLYDGAYDWQGTTQLNADDSDRSNELYHNSERVLRELYVSYRKPSFDLKLGKQQVAWGKMDGQFIDIVNSMDRRESAQLESEDYEYRRLPTWMANATYYFGKTTVQALYIVDFEHDRNAAPGSPWGNTNTPIATHDVNLGTSRPKASSFRDHQYGLRIDRSAGGLTYGLVYMYAWDKNPVERVTGRASYLDSGVQKYSLQLKSRHERVHHVGATADYATTIQNVPWIGNLPTVFRVEALYSNGVRVTDADKRACALAGVLTDGTSKRDTLRAALAIEFALPSRTTFIFQGSWYQTLNYKEGLGPGFGGGIGDEWSLIPLLHVARPFAFSKDRMKLEVTAFPLISGSDTGWGGIKTKVRLRYQFSQFLNGELRYTGYDSGSDTDYYGQFNKYDNFGWELNYEF